MERPTSVRVIAWILIVTSAIGLLAVTMSISIPEVRAQMARSSLLPVSLQIVMGYAGLLFAVVSGGAMLKGQNWGRLLYVIWYAINIVIALLTSPIKMMLIPGLVFYLIITFFLFRPAANAYFSQKG